MFGIEPILLPQYCKLCPIYHRFKVASLVESDTTFVHIYHKFLNIAGERLRVFRTRKSQNLIFSDKSS